jgi:glutamyl-tRNA synthetase
MVKVRIAPSPTGDPHVGTAYSALFNYVFARRNGGAFILRIEDTDQRRSTPESEAAILDSLRWLGLDWDEGPVKGGPSAPYRQSERTEHYREHAEKLVEAGAAYPCFCTSEELNARREAQKAAKQSWIGYDGHCLALTREEQRARIAAGDAHVIRLKVDKSKATVFNDLIRGEIRVENATIDDQVLIKSDGFPTYHLANVVDDHLMGVTHVIRAEEWIPSTPKHVMLYHAFGWDLPVFIHLPLLRNKDKSKISKRKNPVSLSYYREEGYLPEVMLNFLALMGWSTSDEEEVFGLDRMIREMDPKDLHIGSPVFDLDKLDWLNGVYIRAMSPEDLLDRLTAEGFDGGRGADREKALKIIPLVQERMKTLKDFTPKTDFFYDKLDLMLEDFVKVKQMKKLDAARLAAILEQSAAVMEEAGTVEAEKLEPFLRELAERIDVKVGQLFMALRIAVTGSNVSPPLLESMDVLGLDECLARLKSAQKNLD